MNIRCSITYSLSPYRNTLWAPREQTYKIRPIVRLRPEGSNFSFIERRRVLGPRHFPSNLPTLRRQALPSGQQHSGVAGTHHVLRPSFCAWESPSRGVHSPLHSTAARRAYTLPPPSVCTATAPRTTRPTKLSNSDRIVGAMTLAPLKNTQPEPAPTEGTCAVKQEQASLQEQLARSNPRRHPRTLL